MKKSQSGFTLVEIAIVLVIIGLLLGGVLKGQEMIDSARIKNAINDMNGVIAANNSYVDRFRRLPGDDGNLITLQARGGTWAGITVAGDADGVLEITQAQVFTALGEGAAFWQATRAANFITGNPALAGVNSIPRNAYNGLTGIGTGVNPAAPAVAVISVCLSQVPGEGARAIDTQLDDGIPNTGEVLATQGVVGANTPPGAAAAAYNDAQQYTICRRLQ